MSKSSLGVAIQARASRRSAHENGSAASFKHLLEDAAPQPSFGDGGMWSEVEYAGLVTVTSRTVLCGQ